MPRKLWPVRRPDIDNAPPVRTDPQRVLPRQARAWLDAHHGAYETWSHRNVSLLMLRDVALPAGKYVTGDSDNKASDVAACSVCIMMSGWPDLPVDMFWTLPVLRLASHRNDSGRNYALPYCADVVGLQYPEPGTGRLVSWQRWSRHWRDSGADISAVVRRIRSNLATAGIDCV